MENVAGEKYVRFGMKNYVRQRVCREAQTKGIFDCEPKQGKTITGEQMACQSNGNFFHFFILSSVSAINYDDRLSQPPIR